MKPSIVFTVCIANVFRIYTSVHVLYLLKVWIGKGKGKVLPRTGHEGPEGE
jgi:hypothetical protein